MSAACRVNCTSRNTCARGARCYSPSSQPPAAPRGKRASKWHCLSPARSPWKGSMQPGLRHPSASCTHCLCVFIYILNCTNSCSRWAAGQYNPSKESSHIPYNISCPRRNIPVFVSFLSLNSHSSAPGCFRIPVLGQFSQS